MQEATVIDLEAGVLADALKRTRHAICDEASRYYLGGIYLHGEGGKVNFVATDGHRLASVPASPAGGEPGKLCPVIIREETVSAWLRSDILRKKALHHRLASLAVTSSSIVLHAAGQEAIEATPIDGTFPDYQRVIPKELKTTAAVMREPFCDLLNGIAAGQHAVSKSVHSCRLDFAGKTLKVSSLVNGLAASGELELQNEMLAPFSIGFNPVYLAQAAAAADGGVLAFAMQDPSSPVKITGYGDAFELVMPMRI